MSDLRPTEANDPLLGKTWAGRYVIHGLIARGSMGKVYRAEQVPLGRPVALKLLDISAANFSSASGGNRHRERFLREASVLAQLSHANTVRVYDYGIEAEDSYLVMEFVDGRTLRQLFDKRALPPLRATRIARQICASLQEAHELGLIHRDLKPANVLVSKGQDDADVVKVVDFGLVKEVDDALHMTGDGLMVGTPMFMAPEQIRGKKLDQRCDLYALGVILYRMLTGRYPFDGQQQQATILMAHLTEEPLPFAKAAPELTLSPRLEQLVMRCLAKEPADRFLNASELQRALKLCEAELLDETTLATRWSVVGGRVVVDSTLPLPSDRDGWSLASRLALTGAALLFALVFGFVLAQGVRAALRTPAPVVATDEVVPAPAPVVPAPIAPAAVAPAPAAVVPTPAPVKPAPAKPAPAKPAPAKPVAVTPAPAPQTTPAPAPTLTTDLRDPWEEPR